MVGFSVLCYVRWRVVVDVEEVGSVRAGRCQDQFA